MRNTLMEMFIMESSRKEEHTERADMKDLKMSFTRESGIKEESMDQAFGRESMGTLILVNGKIAKLLAMASIPGLMEIVTKGSG